MDVRFDHIALALPRMADATPFLVGVLGGSPAFGADSGVYRFGQWRFANRAPLDVPPPVAIVGLRMRARSRERARTQWVTILQGQEAEAQDLSVIYTWPRSPLRIAVEIDATREEGPLAIEIGGERALGIPKGRHPVLGAVFEPQSTRS